jgi:lipopolysaccharide biosynthesis glycosyltransferase
MYEGILHTLNTNPTVPTMKFPDQDLLSLHFKGKVRFLGYEYNALKTLRECHSNIWRDDKVRNIHYILDKYVSPVEHRPN